MLWQSIRRSVRGYALIALVTLLSAQEPIRVNTRLVQVNVVVRNANGPVADLTKDDFQLFDKGKRRTISVFTVARAERISHTLAANVSRAAGVTPGVVTNRVEAKGEQPVSATVLLIDALNTELLDQQTVRKNTLKFIASMDTSRRMAIYLLGSKLRVLQDFTGDPVLLQQAALKYQGQGTSGQRGSKDLSPIGNAELNGAYPGTYDGLIESFNEIQDAHNIDRARATLAALAQIAAHLARVPGRKTLVWLSSSFPFFLINDERGNFMAANREERTFQEEINRATTALSAADIAIYPVDGRGLLGLPGWDPGAPPDPVAVPRRGRTRDEQRAGMFGKRGNGQLGILPVDTPDGIETMKDLADGTGGRAFYNTNDIQDAIAKAVEDADLSYTLGFYVSDTPDETFHDLKVKLDRPGVEVHYRKGYFFGADKVSTERDRLAIIQNIASTALEATAIGLAGGVERVADPKPGSMHVAVQIDLRDFALDNRDGKWKGGADVAFVSQALDGKVLAIASKSVTFDLTGEVYQARRRDGIVLDQVIEPNSKLNRVRVVVLDHRSGAIGSLTLSAKSQ